jgi:hypothetical protein
MQIDGLGTKSRKGEERNHTDPIRQTIGWRLIERQEVAGAGSEIKI